MFGRRRVSEEMSGGRYCPNGVFLSPNQTVIFMSCPFRAALTEAGCNTIKLISPLRNRRHDCARFGFFISGQTEFASANLHQNDENVQLRGRCIDTENMST